MSVIDESLPQGSTFTDLSSDSWVDRWLPAWVVPYCKLARLDRMIGTWLLLFPCGWGLAMASAGWPDLGLLLLFAMGAVVMRGAGCTINDMYDRNLDAQVDRTKSRPLPSSQLNLRQAWIFLSFQLMLGGLVLFQLPNLSIWLGLGSLPLIVLYPLMKRVTWWPQAFLGITFNWGALVGWAAANNNLEWPAFVLFLAGVSWTIGYDTIYAHQDKRDDARVGLRSTALLFRHHSRLWVAGFYAVAVLLLVVAGWGAGVGAVFFLLLAIGGWQLLSQLIRWVPDEPANCLLQFRSNFWFGGAVCIGVILGSSIF